jgi:hypothetical protein
MVTKAEEYSKTIEDVFEEAQELCEWVEGYKVYMMVGER